MAQSNPFTGSFDGQKNSITNLNIDVTTDYQGMFGNLKGVYYQEATVKDLSLLNCSVTGGDYIGGLIGNIDYYGTVENCNITGTIKGGSATGGTTGGIAGLSRGTVKNSYSAAGVTGISSASTGGLVGQNSNNGVIQNCYSTGSVSGAVSRTGGLVGNNWGAIQSCYSTGDVTGNSTVGGLVGVNGGIVQNCYSNSTVTGFDTVGGLVGQNGDGTIQYCYTTGTVACDDKGYGGVAGVAGSHSGTNSKVRNSVALNPSLRCPTNNFMRVAVMMTVNTMKNNYARSDMVTTYLANPGWYPTVGLDTGDGQSVSATTYNTYNFWTTAANWDGAAWDLDTIWQWIGILPTLRNMPAGNQ